MVEISEMIDNSSLHPHYSKLPDENFFYGPVNLDITRFDCISVMQNTEKY